jgi:hypothetical protein|tara:strand:+ start:23 stop:223 length:201 start_codon:yes stop_codon:yes gene_type:complete
MSNDTVATAIVNVSKEDFRAFQCVRQDGQHNMMSPYARKETSVDKLTWIAIMRNYDKLITEYGDLS